ncbi:MAG: 2-amino-4-hydroxy-6-hydroxymethyldihydropteridine diphosphokinase [Sphingobacteriia bacterium]|nr:2-amino-4-hydroxy-6-hydroxymethyldihydropteridine diphosphokinase [Sphingobacteriia bacterium]
MHTCYLQLGSNLGNKAFQLQSACTMISSQAGIISKYSSIYVTEPWGFTTKNLFFNQVIEVRTNLSAHNLLSSLLNIEHSLGRKRNNIYGYSSRIIDLDILFYEDMVINTPDLILPHPLLHKRRFVLEPLNEIAPDLLHPILGKTIHELTFACQDHLKVQILSNDYLTISLRSNEAV